MPFYKAKNYEIAFLSKKRLLVKKGRGKPLSQACPNITTRMRRLGWIFDHPVSYRKC